DILTSLNRSLKHILLLHLLFSGAANSLAPLANALKCRMGSRPCSDGTECVLYSHVCDGENDCMDGSDEQGCRETCKKGCFKCCFYPLYCEFQCFHGKMCIPEAQVCDGKPQCRDRSDELNCRERSKSCEHRCADGNRCIPKKFLCDGERDCPDGSDEAGCGESAEVLLLFLWNFRVQVPLYASTQHRYVMEGRTVLMDLMRTVSNGVLMPVSSLRMQSLLRPVLCRLNQNAQSDCSVDCYTVIFLCLVC
uniref:WAP domain-containing protein n=1 Tax=Stegastes partitus TaxID=144197 RepID=A0A3B4Z2Y3_9TELE